MQDAYSYDIPVAVVTNWENIRVYNWQVTLVVYIQIRVLTRTLNEYGHAVIALVIYS